MDLLERPQNQPVLTLLERLAFDLLVLLQYRRRLGLEIRLQIKSIGEL